MRKKLFRMRPIGYVYTNYDSASEIPKGLDAKHDAEGIMEIFPEYEEGLQDIQGFSHLYILWVFDRAKGFELIATPPCDPQPHGVFATRSPQRPNPIALTVVELLKREGRLLHLRGVDMLNHTPVLDIKPYLSSIAPEKLKRGWLAQAERRAKNSASEKNR